MSVGVVLTRNEIQLRWQTCERLRKPCTTFHYPPYPCQAIAAAVLRLILEAAFSNGLTELCWSALALKGIQCGGDEQMPEIAGK
jgi:hypothetical protein